MVVKILNIKSLGWIILFWALVVLVVGSFAGTYLGVAHQIPAAWNFLLGHQGYEYIELGRIWQWIEYIGILFWLVLMIRSIIGASSKKGIKTSLQPHILRYHGRYLLWSRVILW